MKQYFLCFANTGYMKLDRIFNQAKEFGTFDKILLKSEKDIQDFVRKHETQIRNHPYGYGHFIWKPKIIYDTLLELAEDDILIYADAGCYINKEGIKRYKEYISFLANEKSILCFSTGDSYKAKDYVCQEAAFDYYPEIFNESNNSCYAGLMILRKTPQTVQCIEEWLHLCENYDYLNKGDLDNGLFNLCIAKHKKSVFRIYPDEVNLYIGNLQVIHTNLTNEEIRNLDWSSLNNIPFQVRRMTHKFGYD